MNGIGVDVLDYGSKVFIAIDSLSFKIAYKKIPHSVLLLVKRLRVGAEQIGKLLTYELTYGVC